MSEKFPEDFIAEPSPEYERGSKLLQEISDKMLELRMLCQQNPEIIKQLEETAKYVSSEHGKVDKWPPHGSDEYEKTYQKQLVSEEMFRIIQRWQSEKEKLE